MLKGKTITLLSALSVVVGLLMIPAAVFADSAPVKYLYENGTECTVDNYISAANWPKDHPFRTIRSSGAAAMKG